MEIRKALASEAETIAELMLFAMKDIAFEFIGEHNELKAKEFLTALIRSPKNQYSFENTWVLTQNNQIAGSFTIYDGSKLTELREPVLAYLAQYYNQSFIPQDETESGEYYIDTIGVFPKFRGQGLGHKILDYIIKEFAEKEHKTIGLLVDINNPKAKKLYDSKGFKVVGQKQLMSENHLHMQYKKESN